MSSSKLFVETLANVVEKLVAIVSVRDRSQQVWLRSHDHAMFVVVAAPEPVCTDPYDKLTSIFHNVAFKSGWTHRVLFLDTNERRYVNESWLDQAERGRTHSYVRIS